MTVERASDPGSWRRLVGPQSRSRRVWILEQEVVDLP